MPAASVPGRAMAELEEIILQAFPTREGLERMLRYRLDLQLSRIVGNVGMKDVVFGVLIDAEQNSWLDQLVQAIIKERPALDDIVAWRRTFLSDRATAQPVAPIGLLRSIQEEIENNLGIELIRTLLLLGEPGNQAMIAAGSINDLAELADRRGSVPVVRRELWAIVDVLLDYLNAALRNIFGNDRVLLSGPLLDATRAVGLALRRAAPHLDAGMRNEPDLLLRLLLGQADQSRNVDRVMTEVAARLSEAIDAMPDLTLANIEQLALSGATDTLRRAMSQMPSAAGSANQEEESYLLSYRRTVAHRLDTLQVLGIDLAREIRRYSLTTAYVPLEATVAKQDPVPVDAALRAAGQRILIEGEAGSGKTTILQWIAVSLARDSLPLGPAHPWWGRVPFFVQLRKYRGGNLPEAEELSKEIAGALHDRQPRGWVGTAIEEGRAVILVDGLDEVPVDQRAAVQEWLDGIIAYAGRLLNIVVITSRPAGVSGGNYDLRGFTTVQLAAMGPREIAEFVRDWHQATLTAIPPGEHDAHVYRGELLVNEVSNSRVLRDLARTPLLCAVLCALNYDRPGGLPDRRMGIYDDALTMMLGRRERDKKVDPGRSLGPDERRVLLQILAEWYIMAGRSEAARDDVVARVRQLSGSLHRLSLTPEEVLADLLERSGVLREPVPGRVDFVHRAFQEFLAARGMVSGGSVGLLVDHAADADWQGVIAMAAGWSSMNLMDQWRALVGGIVGRMDEPDPERRERIREAMVACVDMSLQVDRDIYARVVPHLRKYIPPKNPNDVRSVVAMGQAALPLLEQAFEGESITPEDVAWAVAAVAGIGGNRGMAALAVAAQRFGEDIQSDLMSVWSGFDPAVYVDQVLAHLPDGGTYPILSDEKLLPFTPLLPEHLWPHFWAPAVTPDFPRLITRARVRWLDLVMPPAQISLDWLCAPIGLVGAQLEALEKFELPPDAVAEEVEELRLHFVANALHVPAMDCATLRAFPQLGKLDIRGRVVVENIHELAALPSLRELTIGAGVQWGEATLAHSGLAAIEIDGFPGRDLLDLAGCTGVQVLSLPRSSLVTLDGVQELKWLSELDVSGSESLEDLSALETRPDIDLDGCYSIDWATVPLGMREAVEPALYWHEHPDDWVEEIDEQDPPPTGDDDYGFIYRMPDLGEAEPVDEYLDGWLVGTPEEIDGPHDELHWDVDRTPAPGPPALTELVRPGVDTHAALVRQAIRAGVPAEPDALTQAVRASVLPGPDDVDDWPVVQQRALYRKNERF